MNRSIRISQLWGFAVTALGGTILHFLYDWLGEAVWIAPFSGVNESTWEHMKLLFWPMALFAVAQYFFFCDRLDRDGRRDFGCVKLRGILLGLSLIPIIFYTYNGVVGPSPDWLNIAIFFVSAAVAYTYETRWLERGSRVCMGAGWAVAALVVIALLFAVFTFTPPEMGIFRDPLTGTYGI